MALSKQQWLYESLKIKKVSGAIPTLVHKFNLFCEDPGLEIAEPIYNWQQTEPGKFVMENSIEKPSYHTIMDANMYGYVCNIVAYFDEKTVTYWNLKYK